LSSVRTSQQDEQCAPLQPCIDVLPAHTCTRRNARKTSIRKLELYIRYVIETHLDDSDAAGEARNTLVELLFLILLFRLLQHVLDLRHARLRHEDRQLSHAERYMTDYSAWSCVLSQQHDMQATATGSCKFSRCASTQQQQAGQSFCRAVSTLTMPAQCTCKVMPLQAAQSKAPLLMRHTAHLDLIFVALACHQRAVLLAHCDLACQSKHLRTALCHWSIQQMCASCGAAMANAATTTTESFNERRTCYNGQNECDFYELQRTSAVGFHEVDVEMVE
jgi:hypothetical protein